MDKNRELMTGHDLSRKEEEMKDAVEEQKKGKKNKMKMKKSNRQSRPGIRRKI